MIESWGFYNGNLIEIKQPAIPIESRGLMYGEGCFDTFRTYGGKYFKLQAHLDRLKAGADFLNLDFPAELNPSSLKKMVSILLERNSISDGSGVVRVQLWRDGSRGYTLHGNEETQYSLLVSSLPEGRSSIYLATVATRRIPDKSLPVRLKLCNNINYIAAAGQAEHKGAEDALMQDIDGHVSETTIGNIFWAEEDCIYTPSVSCDLLPGITRGVVLDLIRRQLDYGLEEGQYSLDQIMKAGEVWMCNSVRGLVPVAKIDDRKFDTNLTVFKALKNNYIAYLEDAITL